MNYIVATGTLLTGYNFYGPFEDRDAAVDFGEAEVLENEVEYWVVQPIKVGK